MDLKGLKVEKVLVEQQVSIAREYYAGITLDRANHCYILMLSSMGGIDIEEVAASNPDAIIRTWIDPAYGLLPFQIRDAMFAAGFEQSAFKDLQKIIAGLYRVMVEKDGFLVEVNPLAVTEDGRAIAADAKVDLDDSALFRHPELAAMQSESIDDPLEQIASEKGFAYVRLDGDVGIIGNGAGLVMMTLDVVKQVGGESGKLSGYRWRRTCRSRAKRDRCAIARRERQGDRHQYLWWNYPRRRSREGSTCRLRASEIFPYRSPFGWPERVRRRRENYSRDRPSHPPRTSSRRRDRCLNRFESGRRPEWEGSANGNSGR